MIYSRKTTNGDFITLRDLLEQGGVSCIRHTADIGIHVKSETIEKMFQIAAAGLLGNMFDKSALILDEENLFKIPINVEGATIEDLLVEFLSEILYIFESENFITKGFSHFQIKPDNLKTVAIGEYYDRDKDVIKSSIKAVTYHKMQIKKNNSIWQTDIFFDV